MIGVVQIVADSCWIAKVGGKNPQDCVRNALKGTRDVGAKYLGEIAENQSLHNWCLAHQINKFGRRLKYTVHLHNDVRECTLENGKFIHVLHREWTINEKDYRIQQIKPIDVPDPPKNPVQKPL